MRTFCTAIKKFVRTAVRSSPRPSSPGGTGTLRLSPWASHPVVTHSARQSGDGPLDTGSSHILNKRPPIERDHSPRATSRRTASTSSSISRKLAVRDEFGQEGGTLSNSQCWMAASVCGAERASVTLWPALGTTSASKVTPGP